MSEKQEKSPLTQEQIDNALQVLVRAGLAGQSPTSVPTTRVDRKMKAWHAQREKNKALIAECEQTSQALYDRLEELLTTAQQRDLLKAFSVLVLAPHLVNEYSYNLFKDYNRDIKKKHLKKAKRARGKS